MTNEGRITQLEAARGIASIIVLVHHVLLAFAPSFKSAVWSPQAFGLRGTPFYFLVNGTAAVSFFFVLSGFVLTIRYFQTADASGLGRITLKRLPRLAIPASITIFAGMAILALGFDKYKAVGTLTRSDWLHTFANAKLPLGWVSDIPSAISESVSVFFQGDAYYNSNLWTMGHELAGSVVVIGLALLVGSALRFRFSVYVIGLCLVIAAYRYAYMIPFIAGAGLAALHARTKVRVNLLAGLTVLIVGLALLSYDGAVGMFSFLAVIDTETVGLWIQTLGGVCVILALLCSGSLAKPLSGPVGTFLGRLSFPLYLVHVLVILTIGCVVYLWLQESDAGLRLALIFGAVVVSSLIFSWPLVVLEAHLLPALNRWARKVLPPAAEPQAEDT